MERWQLNQRISLPLEAKLLLTRQRIMEWYEHWEGKIYISVDGFDSTMLAFMVWEIYPHVPAVHLITGNGFPETERFWREIKNKGYPVIFIRPDIKPKDVIIKYGYPIISKEQASFIQEYRDTNSEKLRQIRLYGNKSGMGKISEKWKYLLDAPFLISDKCCDHLKKKPFAKFEKESGLHGILGETVEESAMREQKYLRFGCNAFDVKRPLSRPIAFWTRNDLCQYQSEHNLPYSDIYNLGWTQTGYAFCAFGVHMETKKLEGNCNRFIRMAQTHPKMYNYCIGGRIYRRNLDS